jgi:WD40 repeat protein
MGETAEAFRRLGQQAHELLADAAGRATAVSTLAQLGWRLYRAIFPDDPLPAEIRSWLNDLHGKNAIESLEIASDLPGSTPWNVVYDQPPDEGLLATAQPAAFQPFWGVRYPLTNGRRVNSWRQVRCLESPTILFAADPALLEALPQEQRSRLTNWARDKDLQLIDSKHSLETAIDDQPPEFLCVFCRPHPRGFVIGQDLVTLSELRDLVKSTAPEPLVFLNVADTGTSDPSNRYLGPLLSMGLDGVIATEQVLPVAEANTLGLEFLADFIYGGKPLGAILQTLRARSGPAGLLVTSSCPADLRIVWQKASEGDTAVASVPTGSLPEYPYRPLAAYDREDRALFVGRDEDVADFAGRVDRADTRLLILHGASGVGKASFLHAGVVPYLEDEAIGFQALRDRTPEEEQQDEKNYPVIAIRATHDLAGQLAEALCAFCSQPYRFASPTGKTTNVDLPGILRRMIGAQEMGTTLSTAVRELGPQDHIQPPGGGVSGPPPLAGSDDGGAAEEITPRFVWKALQSDPTLLARLLTALSESFPFELVVLIEQGEEVITQARQPVDQRRRRQALDMLSRAAAAPSHCKLIYSLRTDFFGRLLDDFLPSPLPLSPTTRDAAMSLAPAAGERGRGERHGNVAAFLLADLEESHVLDAVLFPTVAEPIPYADEIPQNKYRFSYAEGIAQTIVRNAREAGNGSESLLPRVQAICSQLYDMLGDRADRIINESDLKALGKGDVPFRLGSYMEKKLGFLAQRSDRRRFHDLLQHFYQHSPDGPVVRNLIAVENLPGDWRGSMPLNTVVESAAAENVRLFELNQLLIGGREGLYVSLSQDALAQAAVQTAEDKRRLAYGRSKMVDMLWIFIPLMFLVAVLVYVLMRSGGTASEKDAFTREQVQKLVRQFQEERDIAIGNPMYMGRMSLASQALQSENTLRARQWLLTQQDRGKADLRGFEWFYLWRQTMQERHSLLGHKGLVTSVAVTQDGKTAASASIDGTVKLWDVGGTIRATFEGHRGPVHTVAFSADGKTIASAGEDKSVRLWDVPAGKDYALIKKSRATLAGHQGAVLALAFSREGPTLVSGGADQTIVLWNTTKAEKEREFKEHTGAVLALAFANDGKTIASGGADHLAVIWDRVSGKQQTLKAGGPVYAVSFSADGKLVATGGADTKGTMELGAVGIWDAKSGKLMADNIRHAQGVFALAFGPGGQMLFTAGKDSSIRVWDAASGQAVAALRGHLGWIRTLALSADGGTLISGSYDQTAKVWALAAASQPDVLRGHKDWVCAVAFSADDKILASGGHDRTVRLWDSERGRQVHAITDLNGPVLAVTFSADKGNPHLAAGTWNNQGEIKIWEVTAGKDRAGLEVKAVHSLKGHKGGVSCLAFSRDGKLLASGGADGIAILWDLATGKEKHGLKGQGTLRALAFSSDDQLLATGGDDKVIRVWEVSSGKERKPALQGHTAPVTALAYLPKELVDATFLVSTSFDQTIRVWSQESNVAMLRGHAGAILSLTLDAKTGSIFTGGWDQTIKAWSLLRPGADERFTFTGHGGPVRGLGLSHDGRTLASASHDGTVRMWRTADRSVLGPEH